MRDVVPLDGSVKALDVLHLDALGNDLAHVGIALHRVLITVPRPGGGPGDALGGGGVHGRALVSGVASSAPQVVVEGVVVLLEVAEGLAEDGEGRVARDQGLVGCGHRVGSGACHGEEGGGQLSEETHLDCCRLVLVSLVVDDEAEVELAR